MLNGKTLQDNFDDYLKAVKLELNPRSIQYIEMRRAFFAGATTVIGSHPEDQLF